MGSELGSTFSMCITVKFSQESWKQAHPPLSTNEEMKENRDSVYWPLFCTEEFQDPVLNSAV